jgi:hypothetical protein
MHLSSGNPCSSNLVKDDSSGISSSSLLSSSSSSNSNTPSNDLQLKIFTLFRFFKACRNFAENRVLNIFSQADIYGLTQ